ncbi:MAG: hypothetical protein IJY61_08635 [Candidatus Gastranaerophilales bacterium]|nr:hypothetical protein [Candidatus Gastranaerophilales bacterium]
MKLLAKEQIKTLLSQKGKKQKDLVEKLSEMTGEKYTSNGLSHKMRRGSVTYNEMLLIAEILGYEINFSNNNNELI